MPSPVVVFTDRSHGDLSAASDHVDERRGVIAPGRWSWLRQVHGASVVIVDEPGAHAGAEGDALVTAVTGCVLAVQVADCAPLALTGHGVVGVVHAGWRGLVAGVVPAAVDAMRSVGAGAIRAHLGPCIRAECYEFGAAELDLVASALGDDVRGTTAKGGLALDVPAAVGASLAQVGLELVTDAGICTACSPDHWSHRAAGDAERQAVVAWLTP